MSAVTLGSSGVRMLMRENSSQDRSSITTTGAFFGAWLGGVAVAKTGSYLWVWYADMALALIALIMVFVPLHYLYRVVAYGSPFPMLFLRYAARVCGARVEVIGTHLRRDVFYVANHLSWVDILALAGASGTAFVAKAELAEAPVVGWLASLNRTVFVKREHRMGVAEQINALKEALVDNWSVTVFPEGTTTDGQSLLPFKTSMLSVLEPPPPGVLVQPVLLQPEERPKP